jgi:hypothetical protein
MISLSTERNSLGIDLARPYRSTESEHVAVQAK